MNELLRVAVADDQELVRNGLRMILEAEADFEVVGEAANGDESVRLVKSCLPDVLLMDVRMPGKDGIAATREIVEAGTGTKVVMLTTFDLDEYVYHSLRAGAAGFLLKDMAGEDIVAAVRHAGRGSDTLLAPSVTRRLVERFTTRRSVPDAMRARFLQELTPRELEVLRLVAGGLSNSEIASELSIGETTVKTHVARLLMKLELRDRVQLVIYAYEAGVIS